MLGKIKTWKVVSLTIMIWLVGTSGYTYYSVMVARSQPGLNGYERWGSFLLFAFAISVLPYLVGGLLITIFAELVIGELIPRSRE